MCKLVDTMRLSAIERGLKLKPVKGIPDIATLPFCFVGDFSVSCPPLKTRFIEPTVSLSPFGFPQTPSELARDYLSAKYKLPLKRRKNQIEVGRSLSAIPLYAIVDDWGWCSYVDIKSAWWALLQVWGWDVEWMPNKYIALGESMTDAPHFIANNKIARSSLVSMTLSRDAVVWTGEKFAHKKLFNRFSNAPLYRLIAETLNQIARIVIRECKAVYVNTDGFIIPQRHYDKFGQLMRNMGLMWSCKATGLTRVYGVGSYEVGTYATKRQIKGRNFSNILEPNEWLMSRWLKAVSYRTIAQLTQEPQSEMMN